MFELQIDQNVELFKIHLCYKSLKTFAVHEIKLIVNVKVNGQTDNGYQVMTKAFKPNKAFAR